MKLKNLLLALISLCICSSTFAADKLIFAIDIVRHGDRTPIIASPSMEKIWPQGPGQLTPQGMHQEYDVGSRLRQQYINQYHLLPDHYQANTMYIRSSEMDRTMMSAESLLLGLYPIGTGPLEGFQPIPIHIVPAEIDTLLRPDYDKKKSQDALEKYIFNTPTWIEKDLKLKPNYSQWSKLTNTPINHLIDLIGLSDRLMIEQLYQRPLPEGLSQEEATSIIDAGLWAFLYISNQPNLAALTGHELAAKIQSELSLAAKEDRPLKYMLFVAHDTTLMAQLKLLGQTIDNIPPYASQLNYALYDTGTSNYEVRVTFNQKPVSIEACGGNACSLSKFLNLNPQ